MTSEERRSWTMRTLAAGALVMAMFEVDYFWIANVIYLGFTLSAITSSIARVIAYRGGFQSW